MRQHIVHKKLEISKYFLTALWSSHFKCKWAQGDRLIRAAICLFLLQGVELRLKHVHAVGVYGWDSVCETIFGEWMEDISQNQVLFYSVLHANV